MHFGRRNKEDWKIYITQNNTTSWNVSPPSLHYSILSPTFSPFLFSLFLSLSYLFFLSFIFSILSNNCQVVYNMK